MASGIGARPGVRREAARGRAPTPSSGARAGSREIIPSKTLVRLRAGDRVEVNTAGGGGYGDPAARPADLLAADFAGGKVSEASWSTTGAAASAAAAAPAAGDD